MKLVDQLQEALISASLKNYRAQAQAIEGHNAHFEAVRTWCVAYPEILDQRKGKEEPIVLQALETAIASKQEELRKNNASLSVEGLLFPAGLYLPLRSRGRGTLEDAIFEHAKCSIVPSGEKTIHEYVLLKAQPTHEQVRTLLTMPTTLSRAGVSMNLCGVREHGPAPLGRVLYEKVLSPSHELYGLLPIPAPHQREFPKLRQSFVVETPIGDIKTHTTTPGAYDGFGERFSGENVKELYTKGVLKAGNTVRVSVLEKGVRYKVEKV